MLLDFCLLLHTKDIYASEHIIQFGIRIYPEAKVELLKMSKDIRYNEWKTFSKWERTYKKKFLKSLSIHSAYAIFLELWDMQTRSSEKDIEKFRKRKIEELIVIRKSFDLIRKRLHA